MGKPIGRVKTRLMPGMGGAKCACCTVGPPSYFKPKLRRAVRRKLRDNLRREVQE